jgi:hypothetical protein
MTPRPMLFYGVREVCQAWCADVFKHGSVKGACLKMGVGLEHFYATQAGRTNLPLKIVEALGLLPVKAVHTSEILGYVSPTPLDFTCLWEEPPPQHRP